MYADNSSVNGCSPVPNNTNGKQYQFYKIERKFMKYIMQRIKISALYSILSKCVH